MAQKESHIAAMGQSMRKPTVHPAITTAVGIDQAKCRLF
jgi:hypothetical protein